MSPLTPRQREALDYIIATVRERGYPPSLKELADALRLRSNNSAWQLVNRIQLAGYIEKIPDKHRAIRVVEAS